MFGTMWVGVTRLMLWQPIPEVDHEATDLVVAHVGAVAAEVDFPVLQKTQAIAVTRRLCRAAAPDQRTFFTEAGWLE
jgi:hypothetical protein